MPTNSAEPKILSTSTYPKSTATATMPSTTSLSRNLLQTSSTWTYLYVVALVTFASLTMSLLNGHQSRTRKTPRSTSVAERIAHYVSRETSVSPTISQHRAESSSPLLAHLPSRETTLPGLDEKHITQLTSIDMQAALSSHIHSLASTYSRSTYLGYTTFETPSAPALYGRHKRFIDTIYLGMICRVDPTTGTTSVKLHGDDVSTVIQAGWGQLASSADKALLHTARDEHDLDVQKQILHAAIGYVCKGEIEEGEDMLLEDSDSLDRPQWLLPRYAL